MKEHACSTSVTFGDVASNKAAASLKSRPLPVILLRIEKGVKGRIPITPFISVPKMRRRIKKTMLVKTLGTK
jgi:hypothetical protein